MEDAPVVAGVRTAADRDEAARARAIELGDDGAADADAELPAPKRARHGTVAAAAAPPGPRAGAEAAELYAGEKEDDLNERVVTFFRKELSHRVRPGCKETMDKHKSDGVRCVMCTSSWQHPARAAAALYGLEPDPKDVISSVMEVDPTSGVLTGKIQKVAYGDGKCVVTKEWADANNIDLNLCWFYTDSMSDVALMEAVGFPVAVNPDARLRKHAETKGWPV